MEPCVPPGFRFHPTDEELVGYYLKKKVESQKIDLDVIRDIDLYRIEPWDLQEWCRIGNGEQKEWYFFSHKDKKYPTGTRTNRATMVGFWKATGRDKPVYDHHHKINTKNELIGMRKTLVFYKGRAPNGQKTDWIIHEYRLESDENGSPQEEGWVVCRAFKKRTNNQTTQKSEASSYYYDHEKTSGMFMSSNIYSMDYGTPLVREQHNNNMICKRETESESLNSSRLVLIPTANSLSFLEQLPQLESPSLPLVKNASSRVLVVENKNENDDNEEGKKVTDWRDLDKFVASQLSHEDSNCCRYDGEGGSTSFETTHYNSDMELLLLQQNRKEEDDGMSRLNGFLISTTNGNGSSECTITENNHIIAGICI